MQRLHRACVSIGLCKQSCVSKQPYTENFGLGFQFLNVQKACQNAFAFRSCAVLFHNWVCD
jgi:hypothetical protein